MGPAAGVAVRFGSGRLFGPGKTVGVMAVRSGFDGFLPKEYRRPTNRNVSPCMSPMIRTSLSGLSYNGSDEVVSLCSYDS